MNKIHLRQANTAQNEVFEILIKLDDDQKVRVLNSLVFLFGLGKKDHGGDE